MKKEQPARPAYESALNLELERKVAQYLARERFAAGVLHKMPKYYNVDYAVCRADNQVAAFFEVKIRNYTHDKFKSLKLGSMKFVAASQMHAVYRVPIYLYVWYLDGLYETELLPRKRSIPQPLTIWGRKDRDDWQDVEPSISISTLEMQLVATITHEPVPYKQEE